MQPEHVKAFIGEFHAELNRLNRAREQQQAGKKRELAEVRRKLDGLIDAIAGGLRSEALQAKLDTFEARKRELDEELVAPAPPAPRFHPNLAAPTAARSNAYGKRCRTPRSTRKRWTSCPA